MAACLRHDLGLRAGIGHVVGPRGGKASPVHAQDLLFVQRGSVCRLIADPKDEISQSQGNSLGAVWYPGHFLCTSRAFFAANIARFFSCVKCQLQTFVMKILHEANA